MSAAPAVMPICYASKSRLGDYWVVGTPSGYGVAMYRRGRCMLDGIERFGSVADALDLAIERATKQRTRAEIEAEAAARAPRRPVLVWSR